MKRRSPAPRSLWIALLAALLIGSGAQAHRTSDSYLNLEADGNSGTVYGQWDIALRDVQLVANIDADGDNSVTWGELRRQLPKVNELVFATLSINQAETNCPVLPRAHRSGITKHGGEVYAALIFTSKCAAPVESLTLDYRFLQHIDPSHRALVNLQLQNQDYATVLAPGDVHAAGSLQSASALTSFVHFAFEGVHHIAIGYDHIAFLLLLLLPSVLRREGNAWHAVDEPRAAVVDIFKVVTAFTIAHSVTLGLATLRIVELPQQAVEIAIAASVLAAGLHNIYPIASRYRWCIAFAFGLLHGIGFANALGGLGLEGVSLGLALVAFNVGVEAGQIIIVVALLPLAMAVRNTRGYRRVALPVLSLGIGAAGALWLWQRAAELVTGPV